MKMMDLKELLALTLTQIKEDERLEYTKTLLEAFAGRVSEFDATPLPPTAFVGPEKAPKKKKVDDLVPESEVDDNSLLEIVEET